MSSSSPSETVLVEFRAGRMQWNGKVATADKRKGRVCLCRNNNDQLVRFRWCERVAEGGEAKVEDELIIIQDAYLERVPKSASRVYVLRFTSSEKKLLFWMQELDETKDEEYITKFNFHAGGIPNASSTCSSSSPSSSSPASSACSSSSSSSTCVSSLSSSSSSHLTQLISELANSTPTAAANTSLGPATAAGSSTSGNAVGLSSSTQQGRDRQPVPLSALVTNAHLERLLEDPVAVKELSEHMPAGQESNSQDMYDVMHSAQMRSTMAMLSQAIYSDQLPHIFSTMGLDPKHMVGLGVRRDPMEAFVSALVAQQLGVGEGEISRQGMGEEPPSKKNKKDEEGGSTSDGKGKDEEMG
eukprot:GHVS01102658.1.p1 GENE.GHVS01102658.1~~GHVS01102658.1.p1  ORF type:complete len:357 (-),score=92.70 GHVS01102658.1:131-1201(-)